MFKLFNAEQTESNKLILEIGNILFECLEANEADELINFYLNRYSEEELKEYEFEDRINHNLYYPELTINQGILDNFPSIEKLKQILF